MTTILVIIAIILLPYGLTIGTRNSIARRMKATIPALKKNLEITLSTELEKIRVSGKISHEAAEFAKDLLKEIVSGRKLPSLLVSAIDEKYPEAINGDMFNELKAVATSSLSVIAFAQKEQIDEVMDFEGDNTSIWNMFTIKIWSMAGFLDMSEYDAIKESYQKTILTTTAKTTLESGIMPEAKI